MAKCQRYLQYKKSSTTQEINLDFKIKQSQPYTMAVLLTDDIAKKEMLLYLLPTTPQSSLCQTGGRGEGLHFAGAIKKKKNWNSLLAAHGNETERGEKNHPSSPPPSLLGYKLLPPPSSADTEMPTAM